jgi:putative aldouronate transport system substrate-binding protein
LRLLEIKPFERSDEENQQEGNEMKRTVTALLAIVLLVSLVAGCTPSTTTAAPTTKAPTGGTTGATTTTSPTTTELPNFNATGMPITKEPTKFTALAQQAATTADWNNMWAFKKIAEITNIIFEIEMINQQSWTEKVNLLFATQTLPEVIFTGNGTITQFDLLNYGTQGLLLPIEEYVNEYAPLVTDTLEKYPDYKASLTSPDGHIYDLRGITTFQRELNRRRFWINGQWVQNVGMSIPKNLDEFYDMLVAFKTQDPNGNGQADEIPIAGQFNTGFAIDIPILVAFGYVDMKIDTIDDKIVYVPTEPNYENYLKYMNKLYQENLIDPDYFSQTTEQYLAKGAQVIYGTVCYHADWLLMTKKEDYSQYISIPPMVSEYNSKQMWPANNSSRTGGLAISNTCKQPEAIARLLDWIFTEEGSIMMQFGPEQGQWDGGPYGWTIVTENGVRGMKVTFPEKYANYNIFRQQELNPMSLPYRSTPEQPVSELYVALIENQVKLTTDVEKNFAPYYRVPFPSVMMTSEESSEINAIQTDLNPYVAQMEARFITGEESFNNYAAFVQGCKDRGTEKLVEIYQQVYDRYLSSK